MTNRAMKQAAREAIIGACINQILVRTEEGETELAAAILTEATKLAKRLTPDIEWHGLPGTFYD